MRIDKSDLVRIVPEMESMWNMPEDDFIYEYNSRCPEGTEVLSYRFEIVFCDEEEAMQFLVSKDLVEPVATYQWKKQLSPLPL